jgi:hypothetical protein
MADQFNAAQMGVLSPEDYAQQQQINRQQQFAQMLMQNNQQPQGQMISGRYVKPSFFQALQPAVNMLTGAYLGNKSDTEAAKLAQAIRGKQQESVQDYMQALNPQQTELAGPTPSGMPLQTVNQPDYRKAFQAATSPYAPAPLQAAGYEMLKPKTLKKGELETTLDFNTGERKQIGQGMPELPAGMESAQIALGLPQNPALWTQAQRQAASQYELGLKRATANQNTINMPPVENAYNKTFGEEIAKQDIALKNIAEGAKTTVGNIARQKEILETGKFFSGKAANVQNELANYGTALGVVGKNGQEKAVNTQSLISGGAGITLDNIKGSGLGAGQGFTDKDLQFLQDAKSFKITFNKENIARVLDLQEKAAIEGAKKWNSRQGQIQKSATVPINVGQIEVPTPYNGQVKYLGPESK